MWHAATGPGAHPAVYYDENDPSKTIGVTSGGGCGCGTDRFVYTNDDGLPLVITTSAADPGSRTTLEEFDYDTSNRLLAHRELDAAGILVTVETRAYTYQPDGSYTATIRSRERTDSQQVVWEAVREESYDAVGRLTEMRESPDLVQAMATPTETPIVTTYSTVENGQTETRSIIRPSGAEDVTILQTTGTPNTAGSTRVVESFRRSVSTLAARLDHRIETYAYSTGLGDYRLSQSVDPSGMVVNYGYDDPAQPARVLTATRSPAGGIGQTNAIVTSFVYDNAGRVISETRPSPSGGTVTTDYVFDDFGRLIKNVEHGGGLLRTTDYVYNGYDEVIFTRNPAGLVRATGYDEHGRSISTLAFEGDLIDLTFDPAQPPGTLDLLEESKTTYHAVSGRIETESVAMGDVPFAPSAPSDGYAVSSWSYDTTTGTWLLSTLDAGHISETSYTYNDQGRVETTTSPTGVVSTTINNGHGLVETETVEGPGVAPLATTNTYTPDGDIASSSHPNGTFTVNDYDEFGRLTNQSTCDSATCANPDAQITTQFEYDDAGNVTRSFVDGIQDTVTSFDAYGRVFMERRRVLQDADSDTEDSISLTEFNDAGLVYRSARVNNDSFDGLSPTIVEGVDQVSRFAYNALGETTSLTRVNADVNGVVEESTDYQYDAAGRQIAEIQDPTGAAITTGYQYDAMGRAVVVTDPANHYAVQTYDARGNLVRRTNDDGSLMTPVAQERWYYDEANRLTQHARMANAASGVATPSVTTDQVTDYEYDDDDRQTTEKSYNMNSAVARTNTHEFDGIGRAGKMTDAGGNWTLQVYDITSGLLVERRVCDLGACPDPNACGTLGLRCFSFDYDGLARLASETAQGTATLVTSYGYDDAGRATLVTDANGAQTKTEYDLLGRLIRTTEAFGDQLARATDMDYDRLDRLAYVEAHDGPQDQRTEYEYDLFGRRTKTTLPDTSGNNTVTEVYDGLGRRTQRTDQRGIVTDYTYDPRGMVITRMESQDDFFDSYLFDALGRMYFTKRVARLLTPEFSRSTFTYNDLSQMTSETQRHFGTGGDTVTIQYDYDQAGNRISMDCSSPVYTCLTYGYDGLNRVTGIVRDGEELANYNYQGLYLDSRQIYQPDAVVLHSLDYDDHRRILVIDNEVLSGGRTFQKPRFDYTYDSVGNRLTATITKHAVANDTITYKYDKLHRLAEANYWVNGGGKEEWNLDSLGNRDKYSDSRAGSIINYGSNNPANEYASIDGSEIQYDNAGNVYVDENLDRYSYDFENRLRRIERFEPDPPTWSELATTDYDSLGRRIQTTVRDGQSTEATLYYYDGQRVLAEHDSPVPGTGQGTPVRVFIDGPTYIDEHLAFTDVTTEKTYTYVHESLHTPTLLLDGSKDVETYKYDAFGDVSVFSAKGVLRTESLYGNPYYFTGRRLDRYVKDITEPAFDLYHYRARAYNPVHGRFLQRDPLGYVDGLNLYEYVRTNPAGFLDPLGLMSVKSCRKHWNKVLAIFLSARKARVHVRTSITNLVDRRKAAQDQLQRGQLSHQQFGKQIIQVVKDLRPERERDRVLSSWLHRNFDGAKLANFMVNEGCDCKAARQVTFNLKHAPKIKLMSTQLDRLPGGAAPKDFVIWFFNNFGKKASGEGEGLFNMLVNIGPKILYIRLNDACCVTATPDPRWTKPDDLYKKKPTIDTLGPGNSFRSVYGEPD